MERSVRFRLTVWYALVLVTALAIFSGLIWFSLRQQMFNEIDQDLAARAGQFERYVIHEAAEVPPVQLKDEMEEFCQALPDSSRLELRGASGFEFHYPEEKLKPGPTHMIERRFVVRGEMFHLQIVSSLAAVYHTLELLRFLLLSLVPVVIAIACLGGAWLSRHALKPVDEVTDAARSISLDNLSLRLRTPQTGDEIQRLTEVWNTMLARLEDAVKTLSQFSADASHELRTPISVIRTSAELALRRARSPESYRESLQEIANESERMTQLVEDLLFLARNHAQSAEMPRETAALDGILAEALVQMRGIAEARRIRLRGPAETARHVMISGNPSALRRLFLVLIDNAIKYSHPDSDVIAAIDAEGDKAVVTIEDFGIGIGPADRPHIFKRFYQADQARTDGGFGLGLSLAQSIADSHGATIDVISREGEGSKFRVVFYSVILAAESPRMAEYRL